MATSYEPLIKAVEEALTAGHALNARGIAEANWFKLGLYADRPEHIVAMLAAENKLCDVDVTGQIPFEQNELFPRVRYLVTVVIDMGYYLGHEALRGELRTTYKTASDDFHRIRSALCYPNNLTTNVAGDATGLAGGALAVSLEGQRASWRQIAKSTDPRILMTQATFPGIVTLDF